MTEPLPAALKIPEVSRFVNRANQLRSLKPAIAYWCEYHAVNQIVGKGLHTTDDDCFAFTKALIERLEATKAEHASDEPIVDNDVAKAYVEQFAQQTFDRAERALSANKVTRQTADTFDAAATFFDILREWDDLETEVAQKIKFAKWNAARILKAIREGRDPNESNPSQEQSQDNEDKDDTALRLDPSDTNVQNVTYGSGPHPVSLQEVTDGGETPVAPQPSVTESYFPPTQQSHPVDQPPQEPIRAPSNAPDILPSQVPPQPSPQIPTKLPSQFTPPPGPVTEPSHPEIRSSPPVPSNPPPAPIPPPQPMVPTVTPTSPQAPAKVSAPAPHPASASNVHQPTVTGTRDYKDINQAQKHAKWAISALNFEDVPTAVQELRNALAALGTQ